MRQVLDLKKIPKGLSVVFIEGVTCLNQGARAAGRGRYKLAGTRCFKQLRCEGRIEQRRLLKSCVFVARSSAAHSDTSTFNSQELGKLWLLTHWLPGLCVTRVRSEIFSLTRERPARRAGQSAAAQEGRAPSRAAPLSCMGGILKVSG